MQLLSLLKELSLHPKNAEELKGLILQLAVQGKLTAKWREENPNVELASVLLKKTKEKKNELIKEKVIGKEKPLSDIDNEEIPYALPNNWVWCRLRDVGYTMTGGTPSKSNPLFFGNDIPFIKPGDILNWQVDYTNEGLSKQGRDNLNRIAPAGSILMVCLGTIGKCSIIKESCCFNQQINSITPLGTDSNYLLSVLSSRYFYDTAWGLSTSTTIALLNKGKWENIPIPIAPLEEQKAIVEVVNQLFAEIEQLEKLTKERISLIEDFVASALNRLTNSDNTSTEWNFLKEQFSTFFTETAGVKKLRETILQLAVQGKLTAKWRANNPNVEPASELLKRIEAEKQQLIIEKKIKKEKPLPAISDDEKPYELPEGWVWCRLRDLVSLLGDGIHGTPTYTPNGPVFFVNGNNLSDGIIEIKPNTKSVSEEEALKHYRELNNRTVLVSINGTIGNTAFYNGEKVMLGKSACYFNLMEGLDKEYIRQLLKTNYFIEYAINSATGTTIKNVSLATMREFIVPLPPLEEQQVIAEKINSLMALCYELEQQIETSQSQVEQLMQSCLKEVFGIS